MGRQKWANLGKVCSMARCKIHRAGMDNACWPWPVNYALFVKNQSPFNYRKTLYEMMYGEKPDVSILEYVEFIALYRRKAGVSFIRPQSLLCFLFLLIQLRHIWLESNRTGLKNSVVYVRSAKFDDKHFPFQERRATEKGWTEMSEGVMWGKRVFAGWRKRFFCNLIRIGRLRMCRVLGLCLLLPLSILWNQDNSTLLLHI